MGECCIRDQDLWKTSIVVTLYILWRDKQIDQRNRVESSDTDSEIYKLDIWQDCLVIPRENKKKFYPFLTPTPPNQFPMDKRLKCKFQSAKTFRRECGRISFWPQDREGFLKQDAKSVTTGRQANKYIKIRNFCYSKDTTKGMKGKPQTRRRYLQHTEQTND